MIQRTIRIRNSHQRYPLSFTLPIKSDKSGQEIVQFLKQSQQVKKYTNNSDHFECYSIIDDVQQNLKQRAGPLPLGAQINIINDVLQSFSFEINKLSKQIRDIKTTIKQKNVCQLNRGAIIAGKQITYQSFDVTIFVSSPLKINERVNYRGISLQTMAAQMRQIISKNLNSRTVKIFPATDTLIKSYQKSSSIIQIHCDYQWKFVNDDKKLFTIVEAQVPNLQTIGLTSNSKFMDSAAPSTNYVLIGRGVVEAAQHLTEKYKEKPMNVFAINSINFDSDTYAKQLLKTFYRVLNQCQNSHGNRKVDKHQALLQGLSKVIVQKHQHPCCCLFPCSKTYPDGHDKECNLSKLAKQIGWSVVHEIVHGPEKDILCKCRPIQTQKQARKWTLIKKSQDFFNFKRPTTTQSDQSKIQIYKQQQIQLLPHVPDSHIFNNSILKLCKAFLKLITKNSRIAMIFKAFQQHILSLSSVRQIRKQLISETVRYIVQRQQKLKMSFIYEQVPQSITETTFKQDLRGWLNKGAGQWNVYLLEIGAQQQQQYQTIIKQTKKQVQKLSKCIVLLSFQNKLKTATDLEQLTVAPLSKGDMFLLFKMFKEAKEKIFFRCFDKDIYTPSHMNYYRLKLANKIKEQLRQIIRELGVKFKRDSSQEKLLQQVIQQMSKIMKKESWQKKIISIIRDCIEGKKDNDKLTKALFEKVEKYINVDFQVSINEDLKSIDRIKEKVEKITNVAINKRRNITFTQCLTYFYLAYHTKHQQNLEIVQISQNQNETTQQHITIQGQMQQLWLFLQNFKGGITVQQLQICHKVFRLPDSSMMNCLEQLKKILRQSDDQTNKKKRQELQKYFKIENINENGQQLKFKPKLLMSFSDILNKYQRKRMNNIYNYRRVAIIYLSQFSSFLLQYCRSHNIYSQGLNEGSMISSAGVCHYKMKGKFEEYYDEQLQLRQLDSDQYHGKIVGRVHDMLQQSFSIRNKKLTQPQLFHYLIELQRENITQFQRKSEGINEKEREVKEILIHYCKMMMNIPSLIKIDILEHKKECIFIKEYCKMSEDAIVEVLGQKYPKTLRLLKLQLLIINLGICRENKPKHNGKEDQKQAVDQYVTNILAQMREAKKQSVRLRQSLKFDEMDELQLAFNADLWLTFVMTKFKTLYPTYASIKQYQHEVCHFRYWLLSIKDSFNSVKNWHLLLARCTIHVLETIIKYKQLIVLREVWNNNVIIEQLTPVVKYFKQDQCYLLELRAQMYVIGCKTDKAKNGLDVLRDIAKQLDEVGQRLVFKNITNIKKNETLNIYYRLREKINTKLRASVRKAYRPDILVLCVGHFFIHQKYTPFGGVESLYNKVFQEVNSLDVVRQKLNIKFQRFTFYNLKQENRQACITLVLFVKWDPAKRRIYVERKIDDVSPFQRNSISYRLHWMSDAISIEQFATELEKCLSRLIIIVGYDLEILVTQLKFLHFSRTFLWISLVRICNHDQRLTLINCAKSRRQNSDLQKILVQLLKRGQCIKSTPQQIDNFIKYINSQYTNIKLFVTPHKRQAITKEYYTEEYPTQKKFKKQSNQEKCARILGTHPTDLSTMSVYDIANKLRQSQIYYKTSGNQIDDIMNQADDQIKLLKASSLGEYKDNRSEEVEKHDQRQGMQKTNLQNFIIQVDNRPQLETSLIRMPHSVGQFHYKDKSQNILRYNRQVFTFLREMITNRAICLVPKSLEKNKQTVLRKESFKLQTIQPQDIVDYTQEFIRSIPEFEGKMRYDLEQAKKRIKTWKQHLKNQQQYTIDNFMKQLQNWHSQHMNEDIYSQIEEHLKNTRLQQIHQKFNNFQPSFDYLRKYLDSIKQCMDWLLISLYWQSLAYNLYTGKVFYLNCQNPQAKTILHKIERQIQLSRKQQTRNLIKWEYLCILNNVTQNILMSSNIFENENVQVVFKFKHPLTKRQKSRNVTIQEEPNRPEQLALRAKKIKFLNSCEKYQVEPLQQEDAKFLVASWMPGNKVETNIDVINKIVEADRGKYKLVSRLWQPCQQDSNGIFSKMEEMKVILASQKWNQTCKKIEGISLFQ